MSGLPAPAERALDVALISLTAFQALDWLVRRHPRPGSLREGVMATGLHVGELARAVSALSTRGVIVAEAGTLALSSAYGPGLVAAWRRMAVDPALHRRAVALAADREAAAAQVFLRITWAPRDAGQALAATPPTAAPSLSACVPGVPGPSRFADPAAPVA